MTRRRLLPVFLLYGLLTLTLTWQSLWWDEGISLHLARISWRALLADRAANIHPPLYFMLLKGWGALAGYTPFAARYLSVLATVLLPAAAYRFVARRFDRRAGRAVALLVALAPPIIIYGQEARAYAFLPLLSLAWLSYVWPASPEPPLSPGTGSWWHSAGIVLVPASLILLHYTGVIVVGLGGLAWAGRCLFQRPQRCWRAWLVAVGGTALLFTPWLLALVSTGAVGLRGQAGLGSALTEPLPASYLWRLLGIFQAVGLPTALSDPSLVRPALLAGSLLGLTLLARLWYRPSPRLLALLTAWLVPFAVAPLLWSLSPQAHPRYLFPIILGGWLLAGVLVAAAALPRLLRLGLLGALLSLCLLGTYSYLYVPKYARSDVRAAAGLLRAEAAPGDRVLIPATDWSLPQYDLGAARALMVAPQEAALTAQLRALEPGQQVYLLDYRRGALDPRGQVRTLLAWAGWHEDTWHFHGVFMERYHLDRPVPQPACEPLPPVCVAGGAPCLVGAALPERAVSGAALPVVLCWQGQGAGSPAPARSGAALQLYTTGAPAVRVAAGSDMLLDAGMRPTDAWADASVTTYHRLSLPEGLLPEPYAVEVRPYDVAAPSAPLAWVAETGASIPALGVGMVTPYVTPWRETPSEAEPLPALARWQGLRLEAARLDREAVYPGQHLYATLRWRVVGATGGAGEPAPRLLLRQAGHELATVPAWATAMALPAGRPLRDDLAIRVPATATAGTAEVQLALPGETLFLGRVEVLGGEHTFAVPEITHPLSATVEPVAELLGFELAPGPQLRSGAPFTLTLVWRAARGAAARDWTVFTHLVGDEGNIVAQHDGPPAGGQRPTSGWVPGEVLVDSHVLRWQQPYAGPAMLRVGLYQPGSGQRAPWSHGEDALVLPLPVQVQAP